jgi:hypothetical protein
MTITALNPLGVAPQVQTAMTEIAAASDNSDVAASTQAASAAGQNVPSTSGSTTGSTDGATAPVLSSEVLSMLLQSQEAENAVSSLFDSSDSISTLGSSSYSTDPLYAALSNISSEPLLSNPQMLSDVLSNMQSSASTSNNLETQNQSLIDYLNGDGQVPSTDDTEVQTVLDTLGLSSSETPSTGTSNDASTNSVLNLLGEGSVTGTEATPDTTVPQAAPDALS